MKITILLSFLTMLSVVSSTSYKRYLMATRNFGRREEPLRRPIQRELALDSGNSIEGIQGRALVPIEQFTENNDNKGNYNFETISADGTKKSERGGLKMVNGQLATFKIGQYSWISPEGTPFTVHYTADEKGFRVSGSHIGELPPSAQEENVNPLPSLQSDSVVPSSSTTEASDEYENYDEDEQFESSTVANRPASIVPPTVPTTTVTSSFSPSMTEFPILFGPPAKGSPLRTSVKTSHFLIDSDNGKTSVRIGRV